METESAAPEIPPLRLVFWETTQACNLRCAHCRRQQAASRPGPTELTTDEGVALLKSLPALGPPLLIFSGGEPLARPDFFTLAERASQLGIVAALATNGCLVTPEKAERIAAAGLRRVAVSLDGPTAASHDRLRAPGAFDQALAGLRALKPTGLDLQVNMTVTARTADKLDLMYKLCQREGFKALHLFAIVPVGCGLELAREEGLSPQQLEETLEWVYEHQKKGQMEIRATCAPQFVRIAREKGASYRQAGNGCLAGRGVIFVSHAGDVFPCGYLPVKAGNVREKSLGRIWREADILKQLRRPELIKGRCNGCAHRNVCLGCRARAYAVNGDYLAQDPLCRGAAPGKKPAHP